jgi:hypothetical protein
MGTTVRGNGKLGVKICSGRRKAALTTRIEEVDAAIYRHVDRLTDLREVKKRLALRLAATIGDDETETNRSRIKRLVVAATNVSWARIVGRQRSRQVVAARWLTMHMLYEAGYSLSDIGRCLSKDHSTVLHARDSWPAYYTDPINADAAATARACWHAYYAEKLS